MLFNSWPRTSQSRQKRSRGRHSCPIVYRVKSTSSWRCVQRAYRRNTCSGSSPTPGPSGVSPGRRAGPSVTLQVDKPAAERVQSRKRKDTSEKMWLGPSKKSRSESGPTPTPSHASGRGKGKGKGKKETPTAKKLQKKKLNPECPTASSSAGASPERTRPSEERQERGGKVSRSSLSLSRSRQGPSPSEKSLSNKSLREEDSGSPYSDNEKDEKEFSEKYLQVNFLQEGGYGQVFAGVRIADNYPVAIKRMPQECVHFTDAEQTGTESLPVEVDLLMKVGAGPGTASCSVTPVLLDWYNLGSEIVLVLERPEPCVDMKLYICTRDPKDLGIEEAKVIFRQLVDKAIVMESKGVFHRDIKPHNILIESGHDVPRARFIDFGRGTTFTPGQQFEEPQGTPIFSSPEWFRQEPYTAGATTVWQLGAVLYMFFFNKPPLISEDTISSKRSVQIPSALPLEIRGLLQGCLEKDPAKRYSLQDVRDHPWLN